MFDSCFLFPIVFKICKCTSQLFIETKRRSEIKQLHKTLPGVAAACSTCTLPHRSPDCVPRNQVIILVLQTIHRRFHDRFSQSAGLAVYHSVLNVKAVVAAFNQEKALVGVFFVIVKCPQLFVNNSLLNDCSLCWR